LRECAVGVLPEKEDVFVRCHHSHARRVGIVPVSTGACQDSISALYFPADEEVRAASEDEELVSEITRKPWVKT
jgi:hypothetical protein